LSEVWRQGTGNAPAAAGQMPIARPVERVAEAARVVPPPTNTVPPSPPRPSVPVSSPPTPPAVPTPPSQLVGTPLQKIGRVISVAGCTTTIELGPHSSGPASPRAQIGSLARIRTQTANVMGIISALRVQAATGVPSGEKVLVDLIIVGELVGDGPKSYFRRGVAHFPCIGDDAYLAGRNDLAKVYLQDNLATINVGTLYQEPSVPAHLLADELFSKHFAIVGTTGCGKSSALTCILQRALAGSKFAHVLVLDMHGEYHQAFGPQAEVIRAGNLHLPFWLLNFQELRSVLTSQDDHYDAQTEILCDAILVAKKRYADAAAGRVRSRVIESTSGTVDSPTPFRLSDLINYIDEQLGKLERPFPTLAYRRLKLRIETLATDPRFGFMFGNPNMEDTMVNILGQLFRVPNDGRPITVIELATVPEEILDVVILLIARLTFDLAVWSDGGLPVLLVCEEAHRYIPADDRKGFFPTRQALSRIAKEGRKYGISLALLTQRPSELDATVLSQCSTILAMRLATESDQRVMRSNVHDSTFGILEYLPLLADREAIVLGRGVPMPMRIRFHDLPEACVPGKGQDNFTDRWSKPNMDRRKLEETVSRWRGNSTRKP
jgi:DNA helicase HerA-like ATPase